MIFDDFVKNTKNTQVLTNLKLTKINLMWFKIYEKTYYRDIKLNLSKYKQNIYNLKQHLSDSHWECEGFHQEHSRTL